jgi:hypothetical protein
LQLERGEDFLYTHTNSSLPQISDNFNLATIGALPDWRYMGSIANLSLPHKFKSYYVENEDTYEYELDSPSNSKTKSRRVWSNGKNNRSLVPLPWFIGLLWTFLFFYYRARLIVPYHVPIALNKKMPANTNFPTYYKKAA